MTNIVKHCEVIYEDLKQNCIKKMTFQVVETKVILVVLSSLQAGSSRVLYDLLPVVSFRGWPAVAQGWLTANHFWDGKITEEEAISGFYLLPCCSPLGGRPDREWRLAFSRSEVRGLLMWAFGGLKN